MPQQPIRIPQLFRKGDGQASRLCFMGHALIENRNGLIVDCELTRATGTAEREAALAMIERSRKTANRTVRRTRVTLGGDKGFDAEEFVLKLKEQNVTPHIAINARTYASGKIRKTAIDGRTTRHKGYTIIQRCRKRIEESFGWAKTIGGAARLKLRGLGQRLLHIPDDRQQSCQNTKAIGKCRLTGASPAPQRAITCNTAGLQSQFRDTAKTKPQKSEHD